MNKTYRALANYTFLIFAISSVVFMITGIWILIDLLPTATDKYFWWLLSAAMLITMPVIGIWADNRSRE